MLAAPSGHALGAMLLTLVMFYAFANGRLKVEIISLLTIAVIALWLYFLPLPGQTSTAGLRLAFEGFGHYALITICSLMIVGRGLVLTGALEPAARALTRVWRLNRHLGLLVTLLLALFMSMLVNDTPVVVLLLPILSTLASRGGMAASKTLIPVNSAVLIGGMSTTIGTSTNLLVVAIASDLGLPAMGVFHFTPIVLTASLVALPFIWVVMPRLLPDNSPETGHQPRRFLASLRLGDSSAAARRTAAALKKSLPEEAEFRTTGEEPLVEDGRLEINAPPDALEEAIRTLGATTAPVWLMERLEADYARTGEDLIVTELAVAADSGLIGKRTTTSGIAEGYNVAILGVHRAPRAVGESTLAGADGEFAEGDIILATGAMPSIQKLSRSENLLMLEGAKEMPRTVKAPLALAITVSAILPASLGLVPIAISALVGAILMFATGCVKFDRVGRALSAKVIVLIAASIAIGRIVLESGAAAWLGGLIAAGLHSFPPAAVLAAVMLFVTILTNFASNTTAAAVGTPIAFSLAEQLKIPVEPLVLAVLFGCNLCYATPIAYQTNMLIMSAADYEFRDYTKTGIPLVVLMIVTLSALLVIGYGLH